MTNQRGSMHSTDNHFITAKGLKHPSLVTNAQNTQKAISKIQHLQNTNSQRHS